MTSLALRVEYVDGAMADGTTDAWNGLRSDGVYAVTVDGHRIEGHSVYWLYWDTTANAWVAGGMSGSPPPPERILYGNGFICHREIVSMPDLHHEQVKLGWWKR